MKSIFFPPSNSIMELNEVYFWTISIHQMKHIFYEEKYINIILESLTFLHFRNLIKVYGFVIMPNHLHFIWEVLKYNGKELPNVSFIKYASHKILSEIKQNDNRLFNSFYVNEKDRAYRFWQSNPLSIKILDRKMVEQKLDYIHLNPLQSHWNLSQFPENYKYSSAAFYELIDKRFSFLSHYMERY